MGAPRRYCGRDFDEADLDTFRRIVTEDPDRTRSAISRLVCEELVLETVEGREQSYLRNEYVDRYHYLGYTPLPGAQLRYFAITRGQVVALFGFSASAWKTEPRDRFIGWTKEQRENRLQYVVNNSRFLILPWVMTSSSGISAIHHRPSFCRFPCSLTVLHLRPARVWTWPICR